MVDDTVLRDRSIRTLAWLGDAVFEREVRFRLARRGDWPTDRLDKMRAQIVRSEAQARLLSGIESELDEGETAVVRRGRNSPVRSSSRAGRNVKDYRAATGLEALVASWSLSVGTWERFDRLLAPAIEAAIDAAISATD